MRKTTSRAAKGERCDLYAEVTAGIVAELEAGRLPWVQPWGSAGTGPCLPHNASTQRPYSGINILLLWGAAQGWLTFKQALGAGGALRKGERGTAIFYADSFVPREKDAAAGRGRKGEEPAFRGNDGPEAAKAGAFLKRFTVFHIDQCDGLPEGLDGSSAPMPECEQVPLAEAVIAAPGGDAPIGGDEAYYAPGPDMVVVPRSAHFSRRSTSIARRCMSCSAGPARVVAVAIIGVPLDRRALLGGCGHRT